jgi:hypothetical protein
VNTADTIDDARRAFQIAGRDCLVRLGEEEPHYAKVEEIAARLEPHRLGVPDSSGVRWTGPSWSASSGKILSEALGGPDG